MNKIVFFTSLDRDIYYAKYYCKGGDGQLGKKIKSRVRGKKRERGKKKGGKLH